MSRKKLLLLLPAAVLLLIAAVLLLLQYSPSDRFIIPDHITVCLDAGHGGSDPGAVFEGRQEKDDNLAMVLAVRDALEAHGADNLTVLLTREEDTALELEERVAFANEKDATLFVSIHRNSGGGQGVETWVSADGHRPETELATLIQANLKEADITKDRGVKKGTASNPHASYYVVGHTRMPACLVELGFIDNQWDNMALDDNFALWAQAIADGILQMVKLK